MNISQIYIVVSIAILAVIVFLIFFVSKNGKQKRLTPLASLAFGFILAGLLFDKDRLIGYGLMGIGVLLALLIFLENEKIPSKHVQAISQ